MGVVPGEQRRRYGMIGLSQSEKSDKAWFERKIDQRRFEEGRDGRKKAEEEDGGMKGKTGLL